MQNRIYHSHHIWNNKNQRHMMSMNITRPADPLKKDFIKFQKKIVFEQQNLMSTEY